jgi:hypothetical protein
MSLDMKFILLPPNRFIEFWPSLGRKRNLTFLDRLNAEHSDFDIDLLRWPLLSAIGLTLI